MIHDSLHAQSTIMRYTAPCRVSAIIIGCIYYRLKLHWSDLLYTACCTTNRQEIDKKSNQWSLSLTTSLTHLRVCQSHDVAE